MGIPVGGASVLVTGGSSGIGAALAVRLAAAGARVGVVGRRRQRLEGVVARCPPGACRMWVADLGDLEATEAVAGEAWDALGGIDVLVNNAAMPMRKAASRLQFADVERTMRVNFLSPARMTLAVLPRMLERGRGVVVNVASVGGRVGVAHEAAYSASKFALSGWSEALAIDLLGSGVEIRLVHPGPIDTEIWDQPGNEDPVLVPPLERPEMVADGVVAAIEGDRFEHWLPDLSSVLTMKHDDIDSYLAINADLRRAAEGAAGPGGGGGAAGDPSPAASPEGGAG